MYSDRLGTDHLDKRISIEHVAARCQALKLPEDRQLIYALQARAIEDKGFERFSRDLLEKFPDRLGPETLRQIGIPRSGYYTPDEVRKIRAEIEDGKALYILNGETALFDDILDEPGDRRSRPSKYPHSEFVSHYRACLEKLPETFTQLCFTRDRTPSTWRPWYFPRLIESCRELLASYAAEVNSQVAETEVTNAMARAIALARETRKFVVVQGPPRLGKSFAAKNLVQVDIGRARYFEVPVYSEDKEFFREMAFRLGFVGIGNLTASELRIKIEDVLMTQAFTIVIDEAHYLLGNSLYPRSIPRRLAWLCSLVNKEIGIVLVTVPKFFSTLQQLGKRSPWDIDQALGRIAETITLPVELCRESLARIAQKWARTSDADILETLADVAYGTPESVAGIQSTARRAQAIADRRGGAVTIEDVEEAAFGGGAASSALVPTLAKDLQPDCNRTPNRAPRPRRAASAAARSASAANEFTYPRLGRDNIATAESVGV